MVRLTELKVEALVKEGKTGVVAVRDGSGLALRITPSGASWQLRYRHGGKAHWLTIGKQCDCSLKEAQKRATKQRAKIGEGIDPIAERRRSRVALKAAKVFRDLATDFEVRVFPGLAPRTQSDYRQYLTKDILPRIGDLSIDEITGGVIVDMVEQVAKRSDSMARRVFKLVNGIYAHAQAKQLVQSNPCAGLKLKAILGTHRSIRPGVSLSEPQLREVLPKLAVIGAANALAVRIILATGVRKSEMVQARWEHIDWEGSAVMSGARWLIPMPKNRKPFVIPLAPVVVEWFRELEALAFGSPWVLPGQNRRDHLCPFTLNAALGRLPAGLPHFHVHDLRRTARTLLSGLGVDVIVAEKCLNHTLGGLVDIYDRGDYFEERRKALELLADFLVRCEQSADKVISLRKAG